MSKNRLLIACAGSGKTTRLVTESLAAPDRRIAIVTYTNSNARGISRKFSELNSGTPRHVDIMTWFSFLLTHCARPYQRSKYKEKQIRSLLFVNSQSAPYVKEEDTERHYFANGELLYSDKISKFVTKCEKLSSSSVTSRLKEIYTDIFIDEFQDLAGWDLEVIGILLKSGLRLTLVGDPRQHIYSTNPSTKNKKYLGVGIMSLAERWKRSGQCTLEYMNASYRCAEKICGFSNLLWPGMEPMTSLRSNADSHAGVFLVAERLVPEYVERFRPQILRNNSKAKSYGYEGVNFGMAKGLQFNRVLVVPTIPIKKYLQSGSLQEVAKGREKLHVAVTRARDSVAFVFDGHSEVIGTRWSPEGEISDKND